MNCPICDNVKVSAVNSLYDDRYAYPGEFELLHCEECQHRYLKQNFSKEELVQLYTDYYPRSTFNIEQYRPHKEEYGFPAWLNGNKAYAFRWVPENIKVLDIGCGAGETIGYHKNRGCDAYGVEADENVQVIAKEYHLNIAQGLFGAENFPGEQFDYVTMDQVIEHMQQPIQTLRNVYKVLKPGGKLIMTTPNASSWAAKWFAQGWLNWHVPYHLQFFNRRSIQLSLERAGLSMETLYTITSSNWLYYQWLHLLTFPEEGQPSGFWSDKSKLSNRQLCLESVLHKFHRLKFNHFITRFADALGVGDNILCIAVKR